MHVRLGLLARRAFTNVRQAPQRAVCCKSQAPKLRVLATTEDATYLLAEILSSQLSAGDCYCLYGQVGTGKSTFARAFIRCAADDPALPVPSPTFLLKNIYEVPGRVPIHHYDLYRLDSMRGRGRLEMDDSFLHAVSLIEWAERLPEPFVHPHLKINFSIMSPVQPKQPTDEVTQQSQQTIDDVAEYEDQRCRQIDMTSVDPTWLRKLLLVKQIIEEVQAEDLFIIHTESQLSTPL